MDLLAPVSEFKILFGFMKLEIYLVYIYRDVIFVCTSLHSPVHSIRILTCSLVSQVRTCASKWTVYIPFVLMHDNGHDLTSIVACTTGHGSGCPHMHGRGLCGGVVELRLVSQSSK